MIEFKRFLPQTYGTITFALSNVRRGYMSPKEDDLLDNEYYVDMVDSSMCCIGKIWVDSINQKASKVYYYPDGDCGFSVESMGCFNKYLNYIQKNYKELKTSK